MHQIEKVMNQAIRDQENTKTVLGTKNLIARVNAADKKSGKKR